MTDRTINQWNQNKCDRSIAREQTLFTRSSFVRDTKNTIVMILVALLFVNVVRVVCVINSMRRNSTNSFSQLDMHSIKY